MHQVRWVAAIKGSWHQLEEKVIAYSAERMAGCRFWQIPGRSLLHSRCTSQKSSCIIWYRDRFWKALEVFSLLCSQLDDPHLFVLNLCCSNSSRVKIFLHNSNLREKSDAVNIPYWQLIHRTHYFHCHSIPLWNLPLATNTELIEDLEQDVCR